MAEGVNAGDLPVPASATPARGRLPREYSLVFALALALYGVSVAPGPLWQDNGMAQVRAMTGDLIGERGLALSHPLYYLIAMAAQALPLGEPALRVNLVSVLFGAVTVANVYLLVRLLSGCRFAAGVGALSLAVAHTFWQHAAMAETYALYAATLSAQLVIWAAYCGTGRAAYLPLLLLVNGLGVSNHLLAALDLAVFGSLTLHRAVTRRVGAATLAACAACWAAGASVYLWIVLDALLGAPSAWPVISSALFGNYAHNVLNTSVTPRLLLNSLLYVGLNFPTPTLLLAAIGLYGLRRASRPAGGIAVAALLAIHFAWAMRYNIPDQYTFFIPTVVLLSVCIGLGAAGLAAIAVWTRAAIVVAALLPVAVYFALPTLVERAGLRRMLPARVVPFRDEARYYLWPWKTGYRGAAIFAREMGELLPDDAYLLADSTTGWPIHYARLTGAFRSVATIWPPLRYAGDAEDRTLENVREWLDGGRLYVVAPEPAYCPKWLLESCEFVPHGFIHRVTGPRSAASAPP